jgi:serralysin
MDARRECRTLDAVRRDRNRGGTGNALNNLLLGNAAANFLNGGAGADDLRGGLGNDVYIVDNAGDVIVEAANGGTDVVRSTVTHILAANVENLLLTGSASVTGLGNALNNNLTGNGGANVLMGGGGADVLSGAAGNDTLYGGGGADRIYGGAGADAFVLNTAIGAAHIDKFQDFSVADDTIWLENAIFTKFAATGALNAGFFRVGAAAADANDHIIYNSATGAVFYDSNGNAAGSAVQIATLSAGLALTSADFLVS